MLSARRKSDGQTVNAYFESKANGPFYCLTCGDPVTLKTGRNRINHFAHINPLACRYAEGESDEHRRCKMAIYESLLRERSVSEVLLEYDMDTVRPDVFATINGVQVAIEVQLSSLSVSTIMQRTIEYFRKGIHVLWLLQWTPELDSGRYTPRNWEKWVHACYFGRVYYWTEGLNVVSYRFEPHFKTISKKSWYSENGTKITAGGYSLRSKRYKTPICGRTLNLVTDLGPRERFWWSGNGVTVPDAKLFMEYPYEK